MEIDLKKKYSPQSVTFHFICIDCCECAFPHVHSTIQVLISHKDLDRLCFTKIISLYEYFMYIYVLFICTLGRVMCCFPSNMVSLVCLFHHLDFRVGMFVCAIVGVRNMAFTFWLTVFGLGRSVCASISILSSSNICMQVGIFLVAEILLWIYIYLHICMHAMAYIWLVSEPFTQMLPITLRFLA